jgi:hypothetical protein
LTEHDETLDRVIETLKEPVQVDADIDRRVMQAIGDLPSRRARTWLNPRWTLRVSPLGALAAAAAVTALVLGSHLLTRAQPDAGVARADTSEVAAPRVVMQFVLVAPQARAVSLVGDFNDWDLSSTQLVRQAGEGVWWVTVPLEPGRYRYAFVVDGTIWRVDPGAPAVDDEFGRRNSVVTIGGA